METNETPKKAKLAPKRPVLPLAEPTPKLGFLVENVGFREKKKSLVPLHVAGRGGGRLFLTIFLGFSPKVIGIEEKPQDFWGREEFGCSDRYSGVFPVVFPVVVVVSLPSPALPPTQRQCLKQPRSAIKWTIEYKKWLKTRNAPKIRGRTGERAE